MYSYLIYFFILFFSTLSAYAYEKSENKNLQIVFLFFSFFIPFIFLVLRFENGVDYQTYVEIFQIIKNGYSSYVEPGYYAINVFIHQLGLDNKWIFIISGFIFIYFVYKAIPKEGFALGVFLFLSIYYFQGGFNQIRQGMAVAIMAYALRYIYSKQFSYYLLYALLAMSLHYATGLILLLMYFIVNRNIKKYFLVIAILSVFIISFKHVTAEILFPIVNIVFPLKAWYLTSNAFGSSTQSSLGILTQLIYLVIAITIFITKDRIIMKYSNANIIINLSFFYFTFYFLHFDINIFSRVQNMFVIYYILSLIYTMKIFEKESRVFIITFISIVALSLFTRYISIGGKHRGYSTHVLPYKTILFDKD